MAQPKNLERTERLVRALGRLRRSMTMRCVRALEKNGDTLITWQLVSGIAHDDLHSQTQLAVRVGMDPAGTSRALDELEAKGLVQRTRDGKDRRKLNVSLTTKGLRWYAKARVDVFGAIAPLFEDLSDRDIKDLSDKLHQLDAVNAVLPI